MTKEEAIIKSLKNRLDLINEEKIKMLEEVKEEMKAFTYFEMSENLIELKIKELREEGKGNY